MTRFGSWNRTKQNDCFKDVFVHIYDSVWDLKDGTKDGTKDTMARSGRQTGAENRFLVWDRYWSDSYSMEVLLEKSDENLHFGFLDVSLCAECPLKLNGLRPPTPQVQKESPFSL
jgi:hypothetical protein